MRISKKDPLLQTCVPSLMLYFLPIEATNISIFELITRNRTTCWKLQSHLQGRATSVLHRFQVTTAFFCQSLPTRSFHRSCYLLRISLQVTNLSKVHCLFMTSSVTDRHQRVVLLQPICPLMVEREDKVNNKMDALLVYSFLENKKERDAEPLR